MAAHAYSKASSSVGPYRLLGELGHGAMARVYLAEHRVLGRQAAIKVLSREAAKEPHLRSWFVREAQVASAVRHDNLVEVYDLIEQGGRLFTVMELLSGWTLDQMIAAHGGLAVSWALAVAADVARGLDALHQAGIIHCDVKPSNIVVATGETGAPVAKLIDYGVCLPAGTRRDDIANELALVGTPEYMAPEQIGSDELDARTDVYGFGCVVYEMLAGRPPFAGPLRDVLVGNVADEPPPLPAETPPRLAHLIARCLAKDPGGRPASMADVVATVDRAHTDYVAAHRAIDAALADESGSIVIEDVPSVVVEDVPSVVIEDLPSVMVEDQVVIEDLIDEELPLEAAPDRADITPGAVPLTDDWADWYVPHDQELPAEMAAHLGWIKPARRIGRWVAVAVCLLIAAGIAGLATQTAHGHEIVAWLTAALG